MMNEKGLALPLTLFVVTMLTVMLAAAFTRTSTEIQIADGSEAGVDALAVAESGLQLYMGRDFGTRPLPGDSLRFNVPGGYAWVNPEVLETPANPMDDFTYVIRSTGYVIDPVQGSDPLSERRIARIALWQTGSITEVAALTAANGVQRRNPGTAWIEGTDVTTCGSGESVPHTRRPAILPPEIPPYVLTASSGGIDEAGTGPVVAAETEINWGTIDSLNFEADYNYFRRWDMSYPSMVVSGDLTMRNSFGTGLLIVTGDLRTSGFFNIWRGVVLVGGRIQFDSANDWFYGAVVSGMDEQLGSNPGSSVIGGPNRRTRIYYSPCEIDNAMASLTGFVPLDNTFIDNWASYY